MNTFFFQFKIKFFLLYVTFPHSTGIYTDMILKSYCMQTGIMASHHNGNLGRTCRTNDAARIEKSPLCVVSVWLILFFVVSLKNIQNKA